MRKTLMTVGIIYCAFFLLSIFLIPQIDPEHKFLFVTTSIRIAGSILLAILSYRYATSMNRSPILWAVGAFLFPFIIPIVLCFIHQPSTPSTIVEHAPTSPMPGEFSKTLPIFSESHPSDVKSTPPKTVRSGSSRFDQLVEELITIGRTDGFISDDPGGKFNDVMRHQRAIEIGALLHQEGKLDLMVEAFKVVAATIGEERTSGLRFTWQGIGGQWDPYYVTTLI